VSASKTFAWKKSGEKGISLASALTVGVSPIIDQWDTNNIGHMKGCLSPLELASPEAGDEAFKGNRMPRVFGGDARGFFGAENKRGGGHCGRGPMKAC